MRQALLSAVFLISSSLGAVAQPIGYDCTLKNTREHGFLQPAMFIAHDPKKDLILVSDPLALHANNGQPVKAKMSVNDPHKTVFNWKVKFRNAALQRATLRYRATYFKADGRFSVVITPVGYSNRIMAKGSCKVGPVSKKLKR